jgi:hypothetical protein
LQQLLAQSGLARMQATNQATQAQLELRAKLAEMGIVV